MLRHLQRLSGPASFCLIFALEFQNPQSRAVVGTLVWMFLWWIFEVIPLGVTALLPLLIFPILGVASFKEVSSSYSSEVIFLFLGGFLLARALEKWGLHILLTHRVLGQRIHDPKWAVLIFISITAFLSMWISNTAAALVLMPLVTSLAHEDLQVSRNLQKSLRLGVGYAASIGGVATIIGSPPNAIFVAIAQEKFGISVGFIQWMYFGTPLAILGCVCLWAYLVFVGFRFPKNVRLSSAQGSAANLQMSGPQKRVLSIFVLMTLGWIGRGFFEQGFLTDTGVALIGIFLLFCSPSHPGSRKSLLELEDLAFGGWPILLLFGGGLALSVGIDKTGLSATLSQAISGIAELPAFVSILFLSGALILITEISSNTAVAAVFVPLGLGLGKIVGIDDLVVLMTITMSASLSFMLPMATPPNAIIFSTGEVSMKDMIRVGLGLNILFCLLISLMTYFWLPIVWDLR